MAGHREFPNSRTESGSNQPFWTPETLMMGQHWLSSSAPASDPYVLIPNYLALGIEGTNFTSRLPLFFPPPLGPLTADDSRGLTNWLMNLDIDVSEVLAYWIANSGVPKLTHPNGERVEPAGEAHVIASVVAVMTRSLVVSIEDLFEREEWSFEVDDDWKHYFYVRVILTMMGEFYLFLDERGWNGVAEELPYAFDVESGSSHDHATS